MDARPLHDKLLVRPIEETNDGRIVIPDVAKDRPQRGEVLAVGNGRILDNGTVVPLEVKVGDRILFGKYSGATVRIDLEDVLVLREEEVLAILEE